MSHNNLGPCANEGLLILTTGGFILSSILMISSWWQTKRVVHRMRTLERTLVNLSQKGAQTTNQQPVVARIQLMLQGVNVEVEENDDTESDYGSNDDSDDSDDSDAGAGAGAGCGFITGSDDDWRIESLRAMKQDLLSGLTQIRQQPVDLQQVHIVGCRCPLCLQPLSSPPLILDTVSSGPSTADSAASPVVDEILNTVDESLDAAVTPAVDESLDAAVTPATDETLNAVAAPVVDESLDAAVTPAVDESLEAAVTPVVDESLEAAVAPGVDETLNASAVTAVPTFSALLVADESLDAMVTDGDTRPMTEGTPLSSAIILDHVDRVDGDATTVHSELQLAVDSSNEHQSTSGWGLW